MAILGIRIWGDSLFRGILYDDKRNRHFIAPNSPVDLAAGRIGLPVINHARMGNTVVNGYECIAKTDPDTLNSHIVLLEFGGNDCDFNWAEVAENPQAEHSCRVPAELYRETLTKTVRLIQRASGVPVLTTLPPLDAPSFFGWITRGGLDGQRILSFLGDVQQIYRWQEYYSAMNESVAKQEGVVCLPLRQTFLSLRPYRRWLCADGIHPNEYGYSVIAEMLFNQWTYYSERISAFG
jgi:acyl-CoA thioesterase I